MTVFITLRSSVSDDTFGTTSHGRLLNNDKWSYLTGIWYVSTTTQLDTRQITSSYYLHYPDHISIFILEESLGSRLNRFIIAHLCRRDVKSLCDNKIDLTGDHVELCRCEHLITGVIKSEIIIIDERSCLLCRRYQLSDERMEQMSGSMCSHLSMTLDMVDFELHII